MAVVLPRVERLFVAVLACRVAALRCAGELPKEESCDADVPAQGLRGPAMIRMAEEAGVDQAAEDVYVPRSKTEGREVKRREDLPVFTANATGRITLREASLGFDKEAMQYAANALSQYHSGIQVEVKDGPTQVDFVLELWDQVGGTKSLVPQNYTADGAPVWPDHTAIIYTPGLDEAYWGAFAQSSAGVLLGTATGEQLNELMGFAVAYATDPFKRLYLPFTVWRTNDETADGKAGGLDNTCDSFTQAFYFRMAEVSVELNTDVRRIRRNYAPLISPGYDRRNPVLVDATDPELKPFFDKVLERGSAFAVFAALGDWQGPFFLPAQVGDPAKFPSKYVKIEDFESPHAWHQFMKTTLYEEMPLPARFLAECAKVAGLCRWWRSCHSGAACQNGQCVCTQCAFRSGSGKVCGGQK